MSNIAIIIPDNGGKHHWAPLGAGQLAQRLRVYGHRVEFIHQDMLHLSVSSVVLRLVTGGYDDVAIGWISGRHTHDNAMALCKAINRHVDARLIIGGHAPSSDPEWYLEYAHADAVIVGPADGPNTIARWDTLEGVIHGDRSDIWFPWVFDADAMAYYATVPAPGAKLIDRVAPVLSGFGCPYRCSFCFRIERGYSPRPSDEIAREITMLRQRHGITFVQFQDELLMTSPERVTEICAAIKPLDIRWSCQGRVNVGARKPAILKTMHDAGCRFVNYGVESSSQNVLDLMNKRQTVEQSHKALQATLDAGISPGVNMLWACPGDDEASLWSNVEMIQRYSDHAQCRTIRPVTPYPGSPLFDIAVSTGDFTGTGDFWEKMVNSDLITVDFMDIPRERAHKLLAEANRELLESYHEHVVATTEHQIEELYCNDGGKSFRGWRQI